MTDRTIVYILVGVFILVWYLAGRAAVIRLIEFAIWMNYPAWLVVVLALPTMLMWPLFYAVLGARSDKIHILVEQIKLHVEAREWNAIKELMVEIKGISEDIDNGR